MTNFDSNSQTTLSQPWRQWQCEYCGHVYDEALGDPDSGIAPGTRWEDIPDDWCCPDCGQPKSGFLLIDP